MFKRIFKRCLWLVGFRLRFVFQRNICNKNIALVVNSFDRGGLEQVVLNLYLGYKKMGWNAYILSMTRDVGKMAEKLLDLRDFYIFDSDEDRMLRFCWQKKIGILHYHYNIFMLKGARLMGFKVLYTMHNVYTWMSQPEILAYSQRLARAHRIIPVSSFVEKYYLARTGATSQNVHTILNGVDFEELNGEYEFLPVTRESLGFSKREVVVAEIASFHRAKHQIGMIGVMEKLQIENPEIKLLLVGNEGDEIYYETFERVLARSPAKENITVVPYFDHQYMGQFLREVVDIFILPTLQEGCSNAVLEAIYCAKPMVLTDVGNVGDVKDVTASEVVPAAYENILELTSAGIVEISDRRRNPNTEALADAIVKISSHLDDYKIQADRAAICAEQYSTAHMVDQYVEVIQSL